MRLIFSRKGFDSSFGGCPSPIHPDGSMRALPIPVRGAPDRYRDLCLGGRLLPDVLRNLAGCQVLPDWHAHLDPDLVRADRTHRPEGWRPAFGQLGAAQGHLQRQSVRADDLFLFFGLFRRVDIDGRFVRGEARRHVLWGWLQIGAVAAVDRELAALAWARDHPHAHMPADPSNTLYIARRWLELPGAPAERVSGAGVFPRFAATLQLTAEGSRTPSLWNLPRWMHPDGRASTLSYHGRADRWSRGPGDDRVTLRSVGRGQEFVLDGDHYPEALPWAAALIGEHAAPAPS
jgi:hypothetical protein